MSFSFLPTMVAPSVTVLQQEFLAQQGIRLRMLDFDNTIVPYTTNVPQPEMEAWLRGMLASQVQLCVVSNSRNERVKIFCKAYGLDCVTRAKKPFSKGIRECLGRYGMEPAACALAGDQIFTDTLGGNCAGVRTILVKPIHNHNFWRKARHVLEKPFIFAARKRSVSE